MSVQVLLQGRILGAEGFLAAGVPSEEEFRGRMHWLTLLSEALPRALIAEFNLSKLVLGTSGGEQFLIVLPQETRRNAEEFLKNSRSDIHALSGNRLDLVWGITENLGDWSMVRKRLIEELQRKAGTPFSEAAVEPCSAIDSEYFLSLDAQVRDATSVSWSPEAPAKVALAAGGHTWALGPGQDAILLPRHIARDEGGQEPASMDLLASRATGRKAWGVLRGDVDSLGVRLRRLQTIEEHVQVSMLFKQFFAGELEVLCSLGEFWRKVTLLSSGGDDFAVCGAWDSLIALASELKRLFQRFSEEHLRDFPGPEGKTITMALALASEEQATLAKTYGEAGRKLDIAKSADKDCFYVLGRVLEWKQLSDAGALKESLTRMVSEFGVGPDYIRELCGMYRESRHTGPGERKTRRPERPWRFYGRINRMLGSGKSRDFQKARTNLIADLVGKNPTNLKLRPSGRVALEWARLSTEGSER